MKKQSSKFQPLLSSITHLKSPISAAAIVLQHVKWSFLESEFNPGVTTVMLHYAYGAVKKSVQAFVTRAVCCRLTLQAPHLTHLGTGLFSPLEMIDQQKPDDQEPDYSSALTALKSIVCLSGFREIAPESLPVIFPVCANLTSLNLS